MACCAIAELTDTLDDTFARVSLPSLLRIDAENTVLGDVADASLADAEVTARGWFWMITCHYMRALAMQG